jgi:hypothetical protein
VVKFGLHVLASASLLCLAVLQCTASQARDVTRVTIEQTGTVRPESDRNDVTLIDLCRTFIPTTSQVVRYFAHAVPVPSVVTSHDRYSPCAAKGKVMFADGFSGAWWLYSDGSARIDWEAGGFVYLLHQPNRWRDPFAPYRQP